MSCKLCFVGQYRVFCLWPALRNCLRTDVALANELCFSGPLAVLRVLGLTAAEKRILALLSVSGCYDALAFSCFCTARQVMSDMDFRELLVQGRVPTTVADALVTAGLNLELFGAIAVSVDALETELGRWVDAELLESEAVVMPALRLLFLKHAHPGLLPGHSAPALQTGSSLPAAPSTSWTETFAPKLDAATISALKSAFEISYPSESLEPEFMPSTRLLSHVRKMVASKDLAFVPWKFRMSVKLHEEHQSSRPAKKARLELTDLLPDEVPSRDIPASGTIGMFHLQQLLSLLSSSLALCKAAHLQTLRTYERAVMRLAGTRFSADSGLRAPHVEELQAADRQVWYEVNALFQKGWTLDDALHEVCNVRCLLPSLLQPRPALPKHYSQPSHSKGLGKSKSFGKKGDDASPKPKTVGRPRDGETDPIRQPWVNHILVKGEKLALCMAFNSRPNGCTRKNCKFLHQCCVARADGCACGGKHAAFEHKATPH